MKKLSILKLALLFALSFLVSKAAISQTVYQSHNFDVKLNGTSNIHDWEMKAMKGTSEASFLVDAKGKVTSISKLSFTLPAINLKSEHTAMDNNTYKALNTAKNPNITFVGASATITSTGGDNYQLSCQGKMTIAGVTKQTELLATGKYNPTAKSFTVTGVKKMKMTDYNVQPPKALLGTIKTGDDISISYNVTFSK
jgi:polyisoprenoid-binding protein YceI